MSSWSAAQVASLSSRLEQEIHKRNLSQSELKMQNQQVSVMRSSEKALKQEINHLLDLKDGMESQNQELRRFEQMRFNEPKKKKKNKVPVRIVRWDLRERLFGCSAVVVSQQQQRLTDCWCRSRDNHDMGVQLKELRDQLEAEQYFTVILIRKIPHFFLSVSTSTA